MHSLIRSKIVSLHAYHILGDKGDTHVKAALMGMGTASGHPISVLYTGFCGSHGSST